jgi:hypothetical protein
MATSPASIRLNAQDIRKDDYDRGLVQALEAAAPYGIGAKDNKKILAKIFDGRGKAEYTATERDPAIAYWRAAARDANVKFGGKDVVHGNTKIAINGQELGFASEGSAMQALTELARGWGKLSSKQKASLTGSNQPGEAGKVGREIAAEIDAVAAKLAKVEKAVDNVVAILGKSKTLYPKYDSHRGGWVEGFTQDSIKQTLKRNGIKGDVASAIEQTFTTMLGRQRRSSVGANSRYAVVRMSDRNVQKFRDTLMGFFLNAEGRLQDRLGKTATEILNAADSINKIDVSKIDGNVDVSKAAKEILDIIWTRTARANGVSRGRVGYNELRDYFQNTAEGRARPAEVEEAAYTLFGWARNKFSGQQWNPATRSYERMPRRTMCIDEKSKVLDGLMNLKKGGKLYGQMMAAAAVL